MTLKRLRDLGNTVIVVEHDEDAIRTADYVIDMGPGAGVRGGQVVAQGTLEEILANEDSLTADYLTGRRMPCRCPTKRRKGNGRKLTVTGATANNLKDVIRQRSRSAPSPASPAFPGRANRPSRSTRSTPPPRAR